MKLKKLVSLLLTLMLTLASVTFLPSNIHIVQAETTSAVGVQYTAHVQNIGWQD